ncbi:MAG: hypothetical protein P1U70_18440 [Saprospiraceae bacterium]|nr:hypothetical protein [Saprospiraceae bacterium]
MSTPLIIWASAFLIYAIFWLWYVGIRKPLLKFEIDYYLKEYSKFDNHSETDLAGIRQFLENDTGKSFVMVNSIVLKKTPDLVEGVKEGDTSLQTLINYHKPFMKMMIKRGGIGIFQGRVAGRSFDVINIENAGEWQISGINRFRSRRDLMEILISPIFHEKHELKFAALNKSIAYPVDPWFQLGGFPLTVGLVLALGAALLHIFLI